jgi:transcriptional regulator of acetoin/glycerol metabolism
MDYRGGHCICIAVPVHDSSRGMVAVVAVSSSRISMPNMTDLPFLRAN